MPPSIICTHEKDWTPLPTEQADILQKRIEVIPAFTAQGIVIEAFYHGRCVAKAPHQPKFDGIFETYHGGMQMAAADSIACFALLTLTGPDARLATTDMNIRFLAPCTSDVRVDARVVKLGRTLCPVHAELFDTENRLVAIAQVTYIRLS